MKTTVARLKLLCVSLMVVSLMFIGSSFAEIDFGTCVGMWLFDEGSGDVAEDSSGKGNSGAIAGGAEWVDGKFGKALSLDGSDDYVEIAHDDSLMIGGGHTLSLWFKLDEVPTGGMTVMTKDDWAPGFWWDGNIIRHHTHDPGGKLHFIDADWKADTEWHHIAITWNGEAFGVYMDGDEIGSGITTGDLGRNALTDKPFLIGTYLATGQHGPWGKFFLGIVDDVAIFNTALAGGDIETLMTDGLKAAAGIEEGTTAVEPSGKLATTWADIKAY